jgi:polar amino acid transport system substrate-binding protein
MKKAIQFILLISISITAHALQADSIRVVTSNKEFPGFRENYVMGSPTSGLEYELVNQICKILKKDCHWYSMEPGFSARPVPIILKEIEQGNYDLAIAFMRGTVERMHAAKASAPYLQTRVSVYSLNDSLIGAEKNKQGAPFFENHPIRYVVVGAYEKTVKEFLYPQNNSSYQIIKVESDNEVLDYLKAGKADATVTSELKTNYSKELDLYNHYESTKNVQWGPRMYVANRNTSLMRNINKALKILIENGTYDQILKKYGSTGREACFQDLDDDATINIVENYSKCKNKD